MNGNVLKEGSGPFQIIGIHKNKDGISFKKVKIRMAQAHSAMTRLIVLWENNMNSFPTNIKLYKSPVLSILLNGCESLTLTADLQRLTQAFQNKCYRRRLGKDHKTNEYMATGQYPRRTSGSVIGNCQASQGIMVRPCMPSRYADKKSYNREE